MVASEWTMSVTFGVAWIPNYDPSIKDYTNYEVGGVYYFMKFLKKNHLNWANKELKVWCEIF